MQVATKPLEFSDFSGGMTDNYINCPLNRGQFFDNLFILENKKIRSRWGSDLDVDDANAQIPAGNQRIGALLNYNNSARMYVQSAKKFYYRNPSAYSELVGPVTSNPVFNAGATTSYISHSEWNRHIFVTNDSFAYVSKIYDNESGTPQIRTAGLPALATSPSVAVGSAGTNNYLYAFHYYYTYTIGSQVFEDRGPVTQVELLLSQEPSSSNNNVTAIPVLANGANTNYDTATIKVHIFRTVTDGNVFYKIGEVTNGTTTFTDSTSDSTASDAETVYTSGGVLDNDPPPLCKFLHVVNNFGYYGHIQEGAETFPNKYRISIAYDPDSVPGQFEDEVEDEIAGVSSTQSIPIILCKRHIYRSEGTFDETGRGFLNHVRISDKAGCISNLSCVQDGEGNLFWAGNDGFYVTDGYKVQKISDHLNESYARNIAAMSNTKSIVGTFDEKYRRIIWTIKTDTSSADNDTAIICELRWGISPEMVFTTMSGGSSFSPTFITFFDKQMYRADHRGYVFVHDETLTVDRKVDLTVIPSLWVHQTIVYDYRGPATGFGTTLGRKWVPKAVITLGNEGNVSVQPTAINDDGASFRQLKPIRYRGSFTWGDDNFIWGNPECVWGAAGIEEQWRRMPARGLRLSYFQMQLSNAYVVIVNSDILGEATLAAVSSIVSTATLPSLLWPDNSIDYYLSFETDDYDEQFLVTGLSTTVATFLNIRSTAPTGLQKWLLKGYPKNEVFSLLSYAVLYNDQSQSQKTYQATDTGGNA